MGSCHRVQVTGRREEAMATVYWASGQSEQYQVMSARAVPRTRGLEAWRALLLEVNKEQCLC
jgi:hypothetical protein